MLFVLEFDLHDVKLTFLKFGVEFAL